MITTRAKLNKRLDKIRTWEKKHKHVKCDCGCYMKDHFGDAGWCNKCGCTWYHPNHKYIMRERNREVEKKK